MRSSVNVELEVRTRDESVDIDADKTSTRTTAMSISGSPESMDGIMLSKPFALTCSCVAKRRPKPPRK